MLRAVAVAAVAALAGCGGNGRHATTGGGDHVTVLSATTTDRLQPVRRVSARVVAEDARLVARFCARGPDVPRGQAERAGQAVAELDVWLGQPDHAATLRPTVIRLQRRYPTCRELGLLRP